MLKKIIVILLVLSSFNLFSGEVFKIEIGKDYNRYSDQDLKRRVWELERAVWQLQQKVFELQSTRSQPELSVTWICKTSAMGESFSSTGASKAIAENSVIEKCKASPISGNGFHCHTPECAQ
jgi:hypothetical protein